MQQRQSDLALAADDTKQWDLLVVGGGLLGAACALEAAAAGLSVLLVEKDDFASGSSSRTSKIAGAAQSNFLSDGADYLHQIAPHMVKDFTFLMPIAPGRMISSLGVQCKLALHDLRAGFRGKNFGHKRLSRKETLRASLALAPEMVMGGLRFHDYFADDSRLVIELIKAARRLGAVTINYLEAQQFDCQGGHVQTVVLKDRLGGSTIVVKPRTVISALGVWTDVDTGLARELVNNSDETVPDLPIVRLRSTHIVLPASALETNGGALLLANPSSGRESGEQNRFVYVVPWQRALLIGSTSYLHEGDIEDPLPSTAEIEYLLHAVNQYTRYDRRVTSADVACAWAGLQVAPTAANRQNKPQVYRAANAVVVAYGAHLANFSQVAKDALRFIKYQLGAKSGQQADKSLNQAAQAAQAAQGAQSVMLGGFRDRQEFLTTMAQIAVRARKLGLDPASLDHLCTSYGKDALTILDLLEVDPALNERICPDFPQLMAEVVYIIDNEMAVSLEDVLCRRIRLGFLHREQCLDAAPRVARMMQEKCGWDSMRLRGELSNLARRLASQLAPVG